MFWNLSPLKPMLRKRFAAYLLSTVTVLSPVISKAETDYNTVGEVTAIMLRNLHFNKVPWDETLSQKLLDEYLSSLDYQKLYFTQQDVDAIRAKYGASLHMRLLDSDAMIPAKDIFQIFLKRLENRHAWIEKHLQSAKYDFASDRSVEISREKATWPKDDADADAIWAARMEDSMLREKMRADEAAAKAAKAEAKKAAAPEATAPASPVTKKTDEEKPEEKILKRYKRVLENMRETNSEEICDYLLSALSACYDPHTEYFSHSEEEQFQTSMRNSLTGIGALLQSDDDGTTQIKGIVEKGPADKQGLLQLDDRVVGVDPNNSGEMIDIVYMKINKVVELIRGEEGSEVRLKVIPAADPNSTTEIVIKREKVELKDQLVNGQIIRRKHADGSVVSMGWIDVPSFYADMEGGTTGVSKDVRKLLLRMKNEGIDGLVIDLRGNGGGSLEEAIKLTGLFIKSGPVVQAKDTRGKIEARDSKGPEPMYAGPMVVVTDKTSASASEIFAAALQDHQRAVVVGDKSTFGKGTVQTVAPVSKAMPIFADKERAGSLKVTIQKFYRIAGGSTQLKGVVPDVILPSRIDALKIGEDALKNPLPYDTIPAREYKALDIAALHLDTLRKNSAARIEASKEFAYIREDVARMKEQIERNAVSLNLAKRVTEREENEARAEARKTEQKQRFAETEKEEGPLTTIFKLTLDNVDAPQLEPQVEFGEEKSSMRRSETDEDGEPIDDADSLTYPFGLDPLKRESLAIATDLVRLSTSAPQTVKVP